MAKDSANQIKQTNSISDDFEDFNKRIKQEITQIKVRKMVKKHQKNINLLDFVGFIDTTEETDSMKDHDLIL